MVLCCKNFTSDLNSAHSGCLTKQFGWTSQTIPKRHLFNIRMRALRVGVLKKCPGSQKNTMNHRYFQMNCANSLRGFCVWCCILKERWAVFGWLYHVGGSWNWQFNFCWASFSKKKVVWPYCPQIWCGRETLLALWQVMLCCFFSTGWRSKSNFENCWKNGFLIWLFAICFALFVTNFMAHCASNWQSTCAILVFRSGQGKIICVRIFGFGAILCQLPDSLPKFFLLVWPGCWWRPFWCEATWTNQPNEQPELATRMTQTMQVKSPRGPGPSAWALVGTGLASVGPIMNELEVLVVLIGGREISFLVYETCLCIPAIRSNFNQKGMILLVSVVNLWIFDLDCVQIRKMSTAAVDWLLWLNPKDQATTWISFLESAIKRDFWLWSQIWLRTDFLKTTRWVFFFVFYHAKQQKVQFLVDGTKLSWYLSIWLFTKQCDWDVGIEDVGGAADFLLSQGRSKVCRTHESVNLMQMSLLNINIFAQKQRDLEWPHYSNFSESWSNYLRVIRARTCQSLS